MSMQGAISIATNFYFTFVITCVMLNSLHKWVLNIISFVHITYNFSFVFGGASNEQRNCQVVQ